MKHIAWTLIIAIVLTALAACQAKKEEKVETVAPPPPPPPTAEELAGAVMDQLNPLLVETTRDSTQAVTIIKTEKSKLKGETNGTVALISVSNQIKAKLKTAREAKQWHFVIVLCDVLAEIEPDQSLERFKTEAQLEIDRPVVAITGFVEDQQSKKVIWFLQLTFPATGKTEQTRQSVGDEFNGYVFLEIIGDCSGIKLKYKPTDAVYDIAYSGRNAR